MADGAGTRVSGTTRLGYFIVGEPENKNKKCINVVCGLTAIVAVYWQMCSCAALCYC